MADWLESLGIYLQVLSLREPINSHMKPEVLRHPPSAGLLLTPCWQTEKQARILRVLWADPGLLWTSEGLWKSFSKIVGIKDRREEAFSGWVADVVCVSVATHGDGLALQREQQLCVSLGLPLMALWEEDKLRVNNKHTWKQASWKKDRQEWSVCAASVVCCSISESIRKVLQEEPDGAEEVSGWRDKEGV